MALTIILKNLHVMAQTQTVLVLKETKAQLVRRESNENIFYSQRTL